MRKVPGPMTAEEAVMWLSQDDEYVRRVGEDERRIAFQHMRIREIEQDLVRDLRNVGVKVTWSWDLVNTKQTYASAIPVLIEHLKKPYPSIVHEGIARALGDPHGLAYWDELVAMYRSAHEGLNALDESEDLPKGDLKGSLAIALSAIAWPVKVATEKYDELLTLLRDTSLGGSRASFMENFARINTEESWKVVEECLPFPELGGGAEQLLKRRADRERRRAKKKSP